MSTILLIVAVLAYVVGVAIKVVNRWSSLEQIHEEFKLIPADVILLTVPINIGNALIPTSAFRYISSDSYRVASLVLLVLLSLFVYIVLLCWAKVIHKRNLAHPFCESGSPDQFKIKVFYAVAICFLAVSFGITVL